jgi:hypothetical protein
VTVARRRTESATRRAPFTRFLSPRGSGNRDRVTNLVKCRTEGAATTPENDIHVSQTVEPRHGLVKRTALSPGPPGEDRGEGYAVKGLLRTAARRAMVSVVTPGVGVVLLALSFVLGLAALVRMAQPDGAGGEDLAQVIRLPEAVTVAIVAVFALSALVFLIDLVRRGLSRRPAKGGGEFPEPPRVPAWVRALSQVLSLLYVIALAYLVWRGAIPLGDLISLGQGAGSAIGSALSRPASPSAPPLVAWTFGVLALVTGLGALALALWVAFGDRLAQWWEGVGRGAPAALEEAVDESLEDLRAERDPRRAIIRCYSRFERVAAGSGVPRQPWCTPMEFMRETLGRLPVPRTAVPTLTALFELAQFSHHALGPGERDRALEALDEIKVAIDEHRANVASG